MSTTFRMPKELEKRVQLVCDTIGKSRSEVIRAAIEKYCGQFAANHDVSWLDVLEGSGFQPLQSGIKNLSQRKDLLRKKIIESAGRRSN